MHLRTKTMLVAMTVGVTTLAVGAAPAHATERVVLSQGHVDVLDVAYEDGQLEVVVHDETVEPDVERNPCDVIFVAKSESRLTVPDDPAFAFLGDPGDPVWVLPQIQDENLLFAGFATEEIETGRLAGDSLRIRLIGAFGPGDFSLFTTDEFGAPTVIFDSGNGLPDTHTIGVGVHEHANWAFEGAGWYLLIFRAVARDAATNEVVTSDPVPIVFHVLA